jgi:non-ribosomal peptide synthetase component E (peptide arylation enzyme)
MKKTNFKKYGVNYPLQNKEIYTKLEETCFKKYGVKNSLMGQVVSTDIVLKHDRTIKEIKMDLKNILNSYEVPMKINLVDKLETNTTGKIIRK